jgi:hypothetical protein
MWEDAPEGSAEAIELEDPERDQRAALKEAHKRDPDVIDFSKAGFDDDLPPKKPKRRVKLTAKERKIEYYRLVKTTGDIGLKHIHRMGLNDNAIEAKFQFRIGTAEFERGFSEPAYEAFKEANRLLPGDRDIRQAMAKAKAVVQTDRAEAKKVWAGKLDSPEEASAESAGLRQWLVPRKLIGWVKDRVAGSKELDRCVFEQNEPAAIVN